ncbi:MAG: ABC transporter permease [Planctomycetota bacterium]|nr:ABC transporter permease [Planctomycetota bacterium]
MKRAFNVVKITAQSISGGMGLFVIISFMVCSMFAGTVASHDPYVQDAGAQSVSPNREHFLGTDDLGRDLFSRVVHGSRISLKIGVISVSIAILIGVPVGLVSGYFGGWIDMFVMRIIDVLMAFPGILLAIIIMAVLGPSLTNMMIAVGIVNIPQYARQVRASVLDIKELDFVLASRAVGATDVRILLKTIFPNTISPVLVLATLGIGTAILDAAGLSFLGLGGQPAMPEWGNMLRSAREHLRSSPWIPLAPGLAISLTVIGFNLFGDALRDVLDPKGRRRE